MSRFEGNGTTANLSRALERERGALAMPDDDDGEHLDKKMMTEWMLDKSGAHQKRQRCVVFTLVHDHKIDGRTQVTSSTVIPKDATDTDRTRLVQAVVDEFDYESREVVKHFPDLQRFVVCAYKKEGATDEERREDPEFSRNFSVSPPPGAAASRSQAYAGGPGGDVDLVQLVTILTKDNQNLIRQFSQNAQAEKDRLVDFNRDLLEHVEKLHSQRYDKALQLEAALNEHATREANANHQRMVTDAQWKLFEGGMAIFKDFAHKWMAARERAQLGGGAEDGKNDAPGSSVESVDSHFLEFARTLEPPQILSIITTLSPEQQEKFQPMAAALIEQLPPEKQQHMLILFQAHQTHIAKKKEEEEAAKRAREFSGSDIKVTVHDPLGPPPIVPAPSASGKKGAR